MFLKPYVLDLASILEAESMIVVMTYTMDEAVVRALPNETSHFTYDKVYLDLNPSRSNIK